MATKTPAKTTASAASTKARLRIQYNTQLVKELQTEL